MTLTIWTWLLAILPVLILLCGILFFKGEPSKVGAVALVVTAVIAFFVFGSDIQGIVLAGSKGMSLSLYVLLIIWGAVFLYNIADKAGAINVVGKKMTSVSDEQRIQCLLLAWCFTSLLQGLAGFGVPVAVVAPIMVAMGFSPLIAVSTCLIGHSWAISFGSMGSSYNSIQLVTGIPGESIGFWMAILFFAAIFVTGFGVMHIYGGFKAVKKSLPQILSTGIVMCFTLWFMNVIGTAQLASLMAGLSGCVVMIIWAVVLRKKPIRTRSVVSNINIRKTGMSFNTAFLPYYLLILLSIVTQIGPVKEALSSFKWGLDYPAVSTSMGYIAEAATGYSKIQFFSHPALILVISAMIGYIVYVIKAKTDKKIIIAAAKKTIEKCIPTSIGITTMVMMALIMSDSGMTNLIAQGLAVVFGSLYPIVAPFVGVLGSFITGSNTNSNVMFGMLQYETAQVLGKSAVLMSAAQSVGGSLGCAISPSTTMMGASNVGLNGKEGDIMKKTIVYCLISTASVGIIVFILTLLNLG